MTAGPALLFFHRGHSDAAPAAGGSGAASILAARDLLGGKGASLHALAALGLRVPPGFTIPVPWCEAYHREGRLPDALHDALTSAVRQLEEIAGKRLGAGLRLAVRSGAAESMPGMLDTVLGVDSIDCLEAAVSRVFDSWRGQRAEAYRREKGVTGLGGTAVTVQEMCPAEAAGVAFTVDPRTGRSSVLIEAVRGLGEGLVSGAVTPDRFLLARPGLEVESSEPAGDPPVIDAGAARAIARDALLVEERFGFPVDIEWAVAGGEVHLLQARAIRAGRDRELAREVLLGDASRLLAGCDGARRSGALFVRHNLDETLTHPTPMTWDLLRTLFRGPAGLLGLYRDLGFRPSKRVLERGFLALVAGRLHAECGLAAEVFFGSDILRHDADAVRRDPALLDAPPSVWASGAATPAKLLRVLHHARLHRRRLERLRKDFLSSFRDEVLPRWSAGCREGAARDLRSQGIDALVRELGALRKTVFGDFPREALKLTYLAGEAHRELVDFLERRLGDEDGRRAAQALLGAPGSESRLEQGRDFSRLIAGEIRIEDFLETHGHRGPGEMDLASPRWREHPEALRRAVESLRRSGAEAGDRGRADGVSTEASVVATLARCGPDAVSAFRERLARARELLPWREAWKHEWMRGFELARRILLELDRRLGLEGQIFHLEMSELEEIASRGGGIDPSLRSILARRREMDRVARSFDLPDAVSWADLEELAAGDTRRAGEVDPIAPETALRGAPIASGTGTGRVWICESPRALPPHGDPYVLVCPSTDPGWMPLLARARALVVERGGALSHGAIVCRDLGVPAVVLPRATRRLEDGAWVRVDGASGVIAPREGPGAAPGAGSPASEPAPAGPGIPPEPWVPAGRPHPGRRAAAGFIAAIVLSAAVIGLAAFRPVSTGIAGALSPALDWTLRAGFSPFGSIALAAAVAAVTSTAITFLAADRRRLRGLRGRLAWYRRELRKRRVSRRRGPDPHPAAARAVEREKLERRAREDSMGRAFELLRPMGWACLPFVLVLVWVEDRFPAHPIRAGTAFEVEAFFEPDGPFLRFARLDLEDEGSARVTGDRYRPVEPNAADPGRGPYHATWPLEALKEGRARMIVTARDSRVEATLDLEGRHDLAVVPASSVAGRREVLGLRVNAPPFEVLLPDPLFRALASVTRWVSGGREITPAQAAFGPVATFILLAVLFTLVLQRCAGLR